MTDNIKFPPMPKAYKVISPPHSEPIGLITTRDALNFAVEAVRLNAQALPCCTNYAAGTTCFSDPKENCPMLSAAPAAPQPEQREAVPMDARLELWLTSGAGELHPRTKDLVVRFARAVASKLLAAEKKYGYTDGWASPAWMDECRQKLAEHIAKGDPRDVAAYCAFLWHHGASTEAAAPQPAQQPLTDDPCPCCEVGGVCKTPECGRLKLPVDHPLRTGVKND